VEQIRKPTAAPTTRTIPVSEHVQWIEDHDTNPNNTTTSPAASGPNIGRTLTEEKEQEQRGGNQESMDIEEDDDEGYDIVGQLSKLIQSLNPQGNT
jgi:hypothetical protein